MSLLDFARTDVVTVAPSSTLAEAAKRMARENVGCLVVEQDRKPVGILTDRDIVTRVVAKGGDPATLLVEQVMTRRPITLAEELSLFEALETMKSEGVRRFPVIDPEGNLSAFFTTDDVLHLLGIELAAVAGIIDAGIAVADG